MPILNTCFVIMPIGDQNVNGEKIAATDLKKRYDDLIKEAIVKADPTLAVVRADEVSLPGTITSDILTRIMHSDIVIADCTYPNPNVFYELGLRHACRPGTIIIKDKNGPKVPFDIAHLRHIEYENTPSGLKELSENLKRYFQHYSKNPDHPDNHLLELAKLTEYKFPDYCKDEYDPELEQIGAFMAIMQHPELMDLIQRKTAGENVDAEMLPAILKYPDIAATLFKTFVKSGDIPLPIQKQQSRTISHRGKKKRR